jgi:6-phosphogluconolactonase
MDEYWMYVGTYTKTASKGIYSFRFQPSTGRIFPVGLSAEAVNPSFLAVHPNNRFLYAVNEVSNYEGKNGYVSAFSVNPKTGQLAFLNKMSSGGSDPCHLAVDKSGQWLVVANYSSGSVSVLAIEADGKLGKSSAFLQHSGSSVNPRRQAGPHAHSVTLSPDNRFLLVSDLGLDETMTYCFDAAQGTLKPNDPLFIKTSPGSGPRHLAFDPAGRFVYQINELNSTLTSFAYDPDHGILKEIQTVSTLPAGFSGFSTTAEVSVHPNGRFVYGSNRGHDSIAVFSIDTKGMMVPLESVSTWGKTPRHFALDPAGNYLVAANQDSDNVVLFRVDGKTGALVSTGTVLQMAMPVCVVFVPKK